MQAFLMLVAVAVVVPLTILATRPEASPTTPPPTRTPDFSLTDAEAIDRFKALHEIFRSASKGRDASQLKLMLVTDSPLSATARDQIGQLIKDGVLDRSRFTDQSVQVLDNRSDRITIHQVVTVYPRFVAEATGRKVSAGPPLRQKVEWILTLEDSIWKVYDSVVLESRRVQ